MSKRTCFHAPLLGTRELETRAADNTRGGGPAKHGAGKRNGTEEDAELLEETLPAGRDPAALLELYRIGFICALAVTLAALFVAVILFFRLDLRGILRRRCGRLRKRKARAVRRQETGRMAAGELLWLDKTGQTAKRTAYAATERIAGASAKETERCGFE